MRKLALCTHEKTKSQISLASAQTDEYRWFFCQNSIRLYILRIVSVTRQIGLCVTWSDRLSRDKLYILICLAAGNPVLNIIKYESRITNSFFSERRIV